MRRLIRLNLGATHEVVDTGEPEVALSLALEHKPDVILLDLRMPKYSGFELCRTFTLLSTTQLIPVFVISGEAGAKTKEFCRELGAVVYFEKPVDFDRLLASLADCLKSRRSEGDAKCECVCGYRLSLAEPTQAARRSKFSRRRKTSDGIAFYVLALRHWPGIQSSK